MTAKTKAKPAAVPGDLFKGYPESEPGHRAMRTQKVAVSVEKLERDDAAAAPRGKRGEVDTLRERVESLEQQNRQLMNTARGQHSSHLRLVCLLLDLGLTADKLAPWQKQLDHIEALERNKGESRVKALARAEGRADANN